MLDPTLIDDPAEERKNVCHEDFTTGATTAAGFAHHTLEPGGPCYLECHRIRLTPPHGWGGPSLLRRVRLFD